MQPIPFFPPFTVEALTVHIKSLLESDDTLRDVWVEGEVSNLSRPQSGHCYFSLKDAAARIQCVMWRSTVARLSSLPQNGQRILAHGQVGVYEPQGAYQLYVDELLPAGIGRLYVEFERLKARLMAEGLFAVERKRPLPRFPRHIGVVTSPTGAAFRDILHVLQRRFPSVRVTLAPTQVQGADAPEQIVAAIERVNRHTDCDVLILARGGGSLEELQPFNDERVARAVHASRIPVVAGVGHETDLTIADMVADRRAPTPTAAAEIVTPDRDELLSVVGTTLYRLARSAERRIEEAAARLTYLQRALSRASPKGVIVVRRQQVDEFQRLLGGRARQQMAQSRMELDGLLRRLHSANPQAVLRRGYAIVSLRESGEIVTKRGHVREGDNIVVQVSDGPFGAQVTERDEEPGNL